MPYYLAKKNDNNFDLALQPVDFKVILGIENRFFICEAPAAPVCDFVVEFPEEQFNRMHLFIHADGKRLRYDPSQGKIPTDFDSETERYTLKFLPEQFIERLELLRWIALNAYLPDMQQVLGLTEAEVTQCKKDIDAVSNDVAMKTFIATNLYYNL